jgi:putative ABC transport system permease protein
MFFRLLMESFRRQRRRKMLAGIAILLGTTAVTAMLALATTIGDRIHKELTVYGANIVVYPKADLLDVKVGGVEVKPASGGAYLKESDLQKLKGIFWANNITAVSPELSLNVKITKDVNASLAPAQITGYWFNHDFGGLKTGAPELHPWWKLQGKWPVPYDGTYISDATYAVLGSHLAQQVHAHIGELLYFEPSVFPGLSLSDGPHGYVPRVQIVGIVTTGDATEDKILMPLSDIQMYVFGLRPDGKVSDGISRVDISARTKPEDAFARKDPDSLSPKDHEIWYCRPYANSIAYQIREAIPGAQAEQVRRVEQSEGNVLKRISGLMWLISAAALLAAGFAVSAAMATTILERRGEIGLMRSLGASKGAIAFLFYAETGLLAVFAGTIGYLLGSGLAAWLGARIFAGDGGAAEAVLIPVLLPVVVALALVVAIAGSTPSIRAALRMEPSAILREDG